MHILDYYEIHIEGNEVTVLGKAELLNVNWFSKKNCVVIDVGISVKEVDGKRAYRNYKIFK